MDKLKPCPFCGGEAVVSGHHNRFTEWYLCSCQKCHISQTGIEYTFRHEAIEAWNRRVNDASVVHEKWLLDRWPSWPHRECSRCKIMIPRTKEVPDQYWQYCPNCGARMDGGNEGE